MVRKRWPHSPPPQKQSWHHHVGKERQDLPRKCPGSNAPLFKLRLLKPEDELRHQDQDQNPHDISPNCVDEVLRLQASMRIFPVGEDENSNREGEHRKFCPRHGGHAVGEPFLRHRSQYFRTAVPETNTEMAPAMKKAGGPDI